MTVRLENREYSNSFLFRNTSSAMAILYRSYPTRSPVQEKKIDIYTSITYGILQIDFPCDTY